MAYILHLTALTIIGLGFLWVWTMINTEKEQRKDEIKKLEDQWNKALNTIVRDGDAWKNNMQGNFTEMKCYLDLQLEEARLACRPQTCRRTRKAAGHPSSKSPASASRKDPRKYAHRESSKRK